MHFSNIAWNYSDHGHLKANHSNFKVFVFILGQENQRWWSLKMQGKQFVGGTSLLAQYPATSEIVATSDEI